jgi:hypothetical protein
MPPDRTAATNNAAGSTLRGLAGGAANPSGCALSGAPAEGAPLRAIYARRQTAQAKSVLLIADFAATTH